MNPKRFGGKANHRQEPWKVPLPQYIEELYFKRFKKEQPDNIRSIEQMVDDKKRKQAERKERRRQQRGESKLENAGQSSGQPDKENCHVAEK